MQYLPQTKMLYFRFIKQQNVRQQQINTNSSNKQQQQQQRQQLQQQQQQQQGQQWQVPANSRTPGATHRLQATRPNLIPRCPFLLSFQSLLPSPPSLSPSPSPSPSASQS